METDREIIMGQRAGRLQLHDVAVILDRFVNASLFQKQVGEGSFHIRINTKLGGCFVFSNRVIHLRVAGTVRSPVFQVQPLQILSEEAVRYFLQQASPIPLP